ncbi:dihydrofolate reductase family protein [Acidiferrimicrobium sp. IK]|uniref:dihydrofolate reductase family protein n=1 Tax=Acidiferrimicrobium sp. IK TaxID=2871700 RepID=UPI0021CB0F88|nr:dihydrofolate reductase family protein [Acidiferrimicrobium sp. IK]MCU4187270.1 dihydrofolate reductase family protein [Acidiferrimicrobium sp. IK]
MTVRGQTTPNGHGQGGRRTSALRVGAPLRLHRHEAHRSNVPHPRRRDAEPGGRDEDPSDAFAHGGWQAPFADPAVGESVTELNSHASAFLLGRRTFDIFRGYWPDQTDPANPIAAAINSRPKYVVSNSLSETDATWRGEHPATAHLVTGDVAAAVRALKDQPGDELQIWGSGKLLHTLLQHELVDRFRLMTFPLVLGSGRRLFNGGIRPATMRPVDLAVTDAGVVIGTYEPIGPVRHGDS